MRLFVVAALALLVVRIGKHHAELVVLRQANALWLGVSTLMHLLVLAGGTLLWSWVIRHFDARVGFRPLLRIWSLASLTRYLPGAVWQFLTAGQLATELGVDPRLLFASLAVHLGFTLLGAGVVGLGAMLLLARLPGWGALLLVLPPLLVHPRSIQLASRLLSRLSRRAGTGPLPTWRGGWGTGLAFLALSILSWSVYGVAFYGLLRGMLGAMTPPLLGAEAAHALSFLGGYFVPFAPAGLGVREWTLAALLGTSLPVGVAASVAVVARLWSIVAELGCALLGVMLCRGEHAPTQAPHPGLLPSDHRPQP